MLFKAVIVSFNLSFNQRNRTHPLQKGVALLVGNGSPGLRSKAKGREKENETHRVKGAIDILTVLW